MTVNDQRVDLEVQVQDQDNYRERSLFMRAREFSTAISAGEDYSLLPRTIIISILGFNQFENPNKFHSEFQVLEVSSHEPLTDKCVLHFFELPKISEQVSADSTKELWLKLFKAETEEDLLKIEALEVSVMSDAVEAYRHVSASSEFREKERLWAKARHDEAQALKNAERKAEKREREKWQGVLAEKDNLIALQAKEKDTIAKEKDLIAKEKDTIAKENEMIATQAKEKDNVIALQAKENEKLLAQLEKLQSQLDK